MESVSKLRSKEKQRNITFDIAKGLCIILVVIGHYSPDSAANWWKVLHDIIYTFHMPVFLFISGYLYMHSRRPEKYLSFIKRKVRRLMLPYIVISFLIITIKLLTPNNVDLENPVTPYSFVSTFWMPSAGYFLWFIWTVFTMFILVSLLSSRTQRLICTIIFLILHFIHIELPDIFSLNQTIYMGVYFMLGVTAFDFNKSIAKFTSTSYQISSLILMVVGEILFINSIDHCSMISNVINKILPFIGICAVLSISNLAKEFVVNKCKWLLVVSYSSYAIYLLHTTCMGPFKSILPKLGLLPSDSFQIILCAIIVILPGIIIPTILHKYVLKKWNLI